MKSKKKSKKKILNGSGVGGKPTRSVSSPGRIENNINQKRFNNANSILNAGKLVRSASSPSRLEYNINQNINDQKRFNEANSILNAENNNSHNIHTIRKEFHTKREQELDIEYSSMGKTFIKLLKKKEYILEKKQEHKRFISDIIKNPFEEWQKLFTRFSSVNNDEITFPELEGVVLDIIESIFKPENSSLISQNSALFIMREQLLIKLSSILFKSRLFLPYRKTIEVITESLFFFDMLVRLREDGTSFDNPYFHTRRYYYYQDFLLKQLPINIVVPTIKNLGATDLLKTRCVPIFFAGVSSDMKFVDEYLNSPIEFYMHDIQHCRRMYYMNKRYFENKFKWQNYAKSRSPVALPTLNDFYKSMSVFSNTIIPLITKKQNDSEDVIAIKAIKKMLIFEIVHEAADVMEKDTIYNSILKNNHETPVEKIVNGDIYSNVQNDIYQDPPPLGNLRFKLQSQFYDLKENRRDYIVPVKFRTTSWIAYAALILLKELGYKFNHQDMYNRLIRLCCDDTNTPEAPKNTNISDDFCPILNDDPGYVFPLVHESEGF